MPERKQAVIIGAGIGGLATACLLAKAGLQVTIFERNNSIGGRAGSFSAEGFTFDTGPSWFLMPEIFEHFFGLMDVDMHEVLRLKRLSPGYTVYFEDGTEPVTIHGDLKKDAATFERIEKGAGKALKDYLKQAAETYEIAAETFLFTNFEKPTRLLSKKVLSSLPKMSRLATQPIDTYVSRFFTNPKLKQVLEYPMVFLGTSPYTAPSLYHLMSHMDFTQGVYYPVGGIYEIIKAIEAISRELGVQVVTGADVQEILVEDKRACGIRLLNGEIMKADVVISNADLHHTETELLEPQHRTYPAAYWKKREAGPSALLMYLGIKGELPLGHHTLLFSADWEKNFGDIFDRKLWPSPASLYICKPSATDKSVAPKGHENLFVLVPIPAELGAGELESRADGYLAQIEDMTGLGDLRKRIVYKKLYGPNDFDSQFNAWKGTALGLSHRLSQSAVFRPQNKSKKVAGLYYVGANTVPGIGLPMCLIGAELVYKRLAKDYSVGMIDSVKKIENL